MALPPRLKFGIFLAPFHFPGQNPTLAIERDLELIVRLDELDFDEAWIGEHHSAGFEIIAAPEIFIATAAERTRHIRLGTGVSSLPYHHPLWTADRMVLLDHLTRGRAMFGIGPGALVTDAWLVGIEPTRQRRMMEEALDAIMHLFTSTEPLTVKTDWFTLNEARLHLRPYTQPHMEMAVATVQSPAGVTLAGKYGLGMLQTGVAIGIRGAVDLRRQWDIAQAEADKAGKQVKRENWRLVTPLHIAESRKEAIEDVRKLSAAFAVDYNHKVLGRAVPVDGPPEQIIDKMVESGSWLIGTPDDVVAGIKRLDEASGGFGGLLVMAQEWTTREKVLRSYELLARYVMPHFQGSLAGIEPSYDNAVERMPDYQQATRTAIEKAHVDYEKSRTAAHA
ncbi:MAG TPA: LLM class flavin-dependent oxidoreductase [Chloroflexota bacterium]|nr:LLM class flavin-dependent oxidoreductase [Chloroflexota bacterium]